MDRTEAKRLLPRSGRFALILSVEQPLSSVVSQMATLPLAL